MKILEILKLFPNEISSQIQNYYLNDLEEIRIRANNPIILKLSSDEIVIDYKTKQDEILKLLQFICDNSIYSFQNQICNGFITINGGHRVGITGDVVLENGFVKNISYIYSLNFRIARQVKGAANEVLKYILNLKNNSVYNTLIVGSPGTGKTTILKDLINTISNGLEYNKFNRYNCGCC